MVTESVRPSAVSGLFYPRDEQVLRKEIRSLLASIESPDCTATPYGLVVPHAGYMYSGQTAAYAYSLLRGRDYETVVIVAPSHREYFDGVSVYAGDAYRTPFGDVPVSKPIRNQFLLGDTCVTADFHGHGAEHAIEVQLPFLQEILGSLTIVPIVVGNQRHDLCLRLGALLARVTKGREILLVASSDLSHYHTLSEAEVLDRLMLEKVAACDAGGILESLTEGRVEACGGGPVAAVLHALHLNGMRRVEILDYRTSCDVTGDESHVVGYLSAAVFG